MIDYKQTLNLPNTKFSMRANLSKNELNILKIWNKNNIYSLIKKNNKEKKPFFLNDGPPYANGNIHIGHAVNKILKDIIIKFKNLSGFNVHYTPSWDCHGLPIEQKIEQENKLNNILMTKQEFRKSCRQYVHHQINNQKSDFIRLGIFGDWENSYLTMNFKNEANIIRKLAKMIKLGYLYTDFKPVHWCISCHSALADAEVEYCLKKSLSIIIKLQAIDHTINNICNLTNINSAVYLAIWTTTPWTLPASRAITLHPNYKYQLINTEDYLIILAKNLVEKVMHKIGINNWKILHTLKGKELENIKFMHPFLNIEIPIILAEHVTLEMGTGAIHTASEFGQDDFNVSKIYNINLTKTINKKGNFLDNIHHQLTGINIFDCTNIIIKLLKINHSLLHAEDIIHSYPHCWRHHTPIISRATQQWFININHNNLRTRCIEYIKQVQWIPKWSQKKMIDMISTRPDWCISRQRTWGVPIPIFVHKKTGNLHPETLLIIKKIIKQIEINGIQAWFDAHTKKKLLGLSESYLYTQVEDILDVWFESGSIQLSDIYTDNNHHKNISDIYIEGSDQHRGWFMSSLIISSAIKQQAPYQKVITHGFVVDKNGKKMSKSIGNTIHPQDIIKKFGADILRLWTASTNYSKEISISQDILTRTCDYYRKIRNTARFLLANLNEFNPKTDIINSENMIQLDKWAISTTLLVQKNIIKSYNNYNFHEVLKHLMNFCSVEMGSFYLDIIKDRQYTIHSQSKARKSGQTAMYLILNALIKWISPILSFTSEELWKHLPGPKNKSVFLEQWSNKLFSLNDDNFMNHSYWKTMLNIKNEVNKVLEDARKNKILGNSLESSITLYLDQNIQKQLLLLKNEIKFLFLTSNVIIKDFTLAPKTNNVITSKKIEKFKISVTKMYGKKCLRCWHIISHLEYNQTKFKICQRCIINTTGSGENREFL